MAGFDGMTVRLMGGYPDRQVRAANDLVVSPDK
jgi:hypothetical protein